MNSIFTKIINREIPSHIVWEDDSHIAFLDINPKRVGHTLVVPKREEDYIFDLEDGELSKLMIFSKIVAKSIKRAFPCNRVGVLVMGLDVAHAHIHLIPMDSEKDLTKAPLTVEQKSEINFKEVAEKIRKELLIL